MGGMTSFARKSKSFRLNRQIGTRMKSPGRGFFFARRKGIMAEGELLKSEVNHQGLGASLACRIRADR